MHPEEVPTESLRPGQVGYIACNMKESTEGKQATSLANITSCSLAHIGDTLFRVGEPVDPMVGFQPTKAMASPLCILANVR